MRAIFDEHVDFVARTLRRAGVPPSDLDDEIQRTFIVADRRIDDVEVGSERSFLFSVAQNLAMRARRTLARRREMLVPHPPEGVELVATPEFFAERKQMRQVCDDVVGALHESLRAVFTLFEVEQMHMTEIAETLGLPRGTVASRLRRARQLLRRHIAAVELGDALPAPGPTTVPEPAPLRHERKGALQKALLAAGVAACASASIHARTLSALGLTGFDGHR